MADDIITYSRLRELLNYDPDTGIFTWLVARRGTARAGSVAGSMHRTTGYWHIGIDGRIYKSHRLAFLYMTGDFPPHQVDHRNGVTGDNRWDNLRPATNGQNSRNSKPWGSSKYQGVSWHKRDSRWQARAWLNGKNHHLGTYITEEEAAAAYAVFAAKHFKEWARLE